MGFLLMWCISLTAEVIRERGLYFTGISQHVLLVKMCIKVFLFANIDSVDHLHKHSKRKAII